MFAFSTLLSWAIRTLFVVARRTRKQKIMALKDAFRTVPTEVVEHKVWHSKATMLNLVALLLCSATVVVAVPSHASVGALPIPQRAQWAMGAPRDGEPSRID